MAEAGTCCCVVRVAGQVTSTHLQNEYHGTQVRQQCVTIPLACYPCLSCSKHHARCMWAGCLDLTKLCAGPSAVCLSHTGFVRSRQPSLIRTGFARSRWPSLIRTACRVLLNKTGAGHRYGTRQRTRSPSHGHVYCLVATITWPCVLPGCDHPKGSNKNNNDNNQPLTPWQKDGLNIHYMQGWSLHPPHWQKGGLYIHYIRFSSCAVF